MPSIEVDGNYLSESLAIARYAEQIKPTPALLPSDPFEAAKVVELVCHLKLDVELTARRCLPVLFGQTVSDETKKETEKDLTKGMKPVSRFVATLTLLAKKYWLISTPSILSVSQIPCLRNSLRKPAGRSLRHSSTGYSLPLTRARKGRRGKGTLIVKQHPKEKKTPWRISGNQRVCRSFLASAMPSVLNFPQQSQRLRRCRRTD